MAEVGGGSGGGEGVALGTGRCGGNRGSGARPADIFMMPPTAPQPTVEQQVAASMSETYAKKLRQFMQERAQELEAVPATAA